jgi:C4-dicarboxylate-binding protein DctP
MLARSTSVRRIAAAAAALMTLAVAAPAVAQCDPGERVIRFSHVTAAKGHPKGEAATALKARIDEQLNGRACMEVYPNSTLFNDDDAMFQALLDGDLEMAAPSIAKMSSLSPRFQVFDLPFMFQDLEAVINFSYTPEGEALLLAGQPKGFVGLSYWLNGMRQISATRPILQPSDVNGLTFRIQGSPVELAYYAIMGGKSKKLSFAAVYDALASGEVDGQENSWSNIYTKRFYRVQDSITITNHSLIAYIVVTSQAFLQSLDPALREDLQQILAEVTHERNRFAFQLDEVNQMKILEDGGTINRLKDAQRQVWVDTLKPVWAQFEEGIGADLIAAAQKSNTAGF